MKISKSEFKRLRLKAKLTQPELAEKLGIHPMTVSLKERGINPVTRMDIYALKSLLAEIIVTQ